VLWTTRSSAVVEQTFTNLNDRSRMVDQIGGRENQASVNVLHRQSLAFAMYQT
jgi:hypothetical protein